MSAPGPETPDIDWLANHDFSMVSWDERERAARELTGPDCRRMIQDATYVWTGDMLMVCFLLPDGSRRIFDCRINRVGYVPGKQV